MTATVLIRFFMSGETLITGNPSDSYPGKNLFYPLATLESNVSLLSKVVYEREGHLERFSLAEEDHGAMVQSVRSFSGESFLSDMIIFT